MQTSPSFQQQGAELISQSSLQTDSTGVTRQHFSMGAILRTDVFIPSSAFKKLSSSPAIIIPSPGPGLFLNVLEAIVRYNFGTTPYGTATNFAFLYEPGNSVWGAVLATLPTATQSQIEYGVVGAVGSGNFNTNALDNSNLSFAAIGGDPTGGDGTLRITTLYTIESTS